MFQKAKNDTWLSTAVRTAWEYKWIDFWESSNRNYTATKCSYFINSSETAAQPKAREKAKFSYGEETE